jgi:hypothetical protein
MSKSAVTILFCLIFFMEAAFPRIEFSDLINLPILFQHFQKHKLESPGISFVGFLSLHYGDSDHANQDSKNHAKLPFSKSHRNIAFQQIVQYPAVVDFSTSFKVLMKIEGVSYRECSVNPVLVPIWQPPKI